MPSHPLTKALLVATLVGIWLAAEEPSLARVLALVLGAALTLWAWIRLGRRRAKSSASVDWPAAFAGSEGRLARAPAGRGARDVRCPATRAGTRAQRPARR